MTSLRLACVRRNFELEEIKYVVKGKRILLREDPLMLLGGGPSEFKKDEADQKNADNDTAASSITH